MSRFLWAIAVGALVGGGCSRGAPIVEREPSPPSTAPVILAAGADDEATSVRKLLERADAELARLDVFTQHAESGEGPDGDSVRAALKGPGRRLHDERDKIARDVESLGASASAPGRAVVAREVGQLLDAIAKAEAAEFEGD